MERRIFFKAAVLCLAMIAGCISLTACSNDDDEPEVTNDLTTIKTAFSVSLSEDWYMFFDIEVKYVSETGEQTVTLTQDWSFDAEIPYSAAPDMLACYVTAKPKADAPAIEAGVTYVLEESIHASVSGILKDGTQDARYGSQGERIGREEKSGKGMEKYIQGEHSLFSFSFIPEK